MVQDATVAIEHGASALDQLVAIFGIYPLWLCPCLNVSLAAGASEESRNAALVKLKPHRERHNGGTLVPTHLPS